MKLIYKARGRGKTTELIKYAKKLKGYNIIVVSTKEEVMRIWKIIIEKKYDIPQPISFDEFLNRQYCGRNINSFLIDNVDLLIQYLSRGVNVEVITLTKCKLKWLWWRKQNE